MNSEHGKSHGTNHHKGKISYLDSLERRGEFAPEQLISVSPIKETDTILDFGAGTGYFSLPLAKAVKGTVYALDIDASMLELINSKALKEEITNIVTIQGSDAEVSVPDGSIDVVIASLVLHEIQPLAAAIIRIKGALKEEGYLICVELEPKRHSGHQAPRITSADMERELTAAGLRITKKFFPTENLYVLVAQK
ncbi:class I SAM-dependent methyltransferase [Planomicrobium sp. CPCC 101079]|uniref:class I SAM-dependent methyltransferase n=1 Tax=Planomicrobium sp. CPCC 101079 TaxID=2599618 RepID=UPI0011B708D2|nr:class I SAM-dependent methyltransferase [Planomicrobium sp. CPCC 101079]TWT00175.1 class I SAM-dependent methyltransferase [Planomicrobium sp. CPCC 101079]